MFFLGLWRVWWVWRSFLSVFRSLMGFIFYFLVGLEGVLISVLLGL